MRIAVNAVFWGQESTGSGQYLHRLVDEVAALAPSHELLLLSPVGTPSFPRQGDLHYAVKTPFDGLNGNLAKLWFEQIAFGRACEQLRADVAHVPYFAPPLHTTVPTLVTIHDLIPLLLRGYRGSLLVRLYSALAVRAARSVPLILTDSRASSRDIICRLRIPADRVLVVPLAAGAGYYSPVSSTAREAVARKYEIPGAYFLYLGGFDRRKNVTTLLQAFAAALDTISPVTSAQPWLVLAGRLPDADTSFTPDPVRIARDLGVEERVIFTGWVPEVDKPALYAGACAFLFPSQYEGFGLPPLEAMACGTPVIASNTSSLPEVVGPGGLLVPPTDVAALTRAMLALWEKSDLRQTLSEAARRHASHFNWTETARATLEAYLQVATENGKRQGDL